jgi:hypothetical protein
MATPSAPDRWREDSARRLLDGVHRRASLGEAIGILQVWRACGQQQARDDLHTDHGAAGQDNEATRVIAVVNATAEGRTDPDATWD